LQKKEKTLPYVSYPPQPIYVPMAKEVSVLLGPEEPQECLQALIRP